MNDSNLYLILALTILIALVVLMFLARKSGKMKKMTMLTRISILLVIFSMVFEDRWIAYSLLGIAVILAVIDLILKRR